MASIMAGTQHMIRKREQLLSYKLGAQKTRFRPFSSVVGGARVGGRKKDNERPCKVGSVG